MSVYVFVYVLLLIHSRRYREVSHLMQRSRWPLSWYGAACALAVINRTNLGQRGVTPHHIGVVGWGHIQHGARGTYWRWHHQDIPSDVVDFAFDEQILRVLKCRVDFMQHTVKVL